MKICDELWYTNIPIYIHWFKWMYVVYIYIYKHVHVHKYHNLMLYQSTSNLQIYDRHRFLSTSTWGSELGQRHRRLKIFFAGAKQRRVGRLQQAQNVLGKEQHSCVQGRKSNAFREIFTCRSSFAWFACIGTPWKIRIFTENQWLEDVFSHWSSPFLGFMLILRGVFPV